MYIKNNLASLTIPFCESKSKLYGPLSPKLSVIFERIKFFSKGHKKNEL